MPRFLKARSIAFETASSSAGTNLGKPSIIVTSAPNDFQTLANSTPITPPPRMITLAGTLLNLRACSELITCVPSTSKLGSDFGKEPVARTTCFPSKTWSPTMTLLGPTNFPFPVT